MSALQKGEKVLITGATGWIGSHVAHEALAAGLDIKLAIRDEGKAKTLIEALEKLHGKGGRIETVRVADFTHKGAFDEAVQGVQAVVHTASDMTFSSNPDEVIPPVLESYKVILEAANGQKQIRRFVFTSSSCALGMPVTDASKKQHFDVDIWNDASVQAMTKPNPSGFQVYAASKALSEKSVWDFVGAHKPSFVTTSINPNANLGAPVPGLPFASTGKWVVEAAQGNLDSLSNAGSQYHVDVNDVAKLHVIALTREDVKNERILAFATKFNANVILDAIRKAKPDAQVGENRREWGALDQTTVDIGRANELLESQGGLRDLDVSVRETLQAM